MSTSPVSPSWCLNTTSLIINCLELAQYCTLSFTEPSASDDKSLTLPMTILPSPGTTVDQQLTVLLATRPSWDSSPFALLQMPRVKKRHVASLPPASFMKHCNIWSRPAGAPVTIDFALCLRSRPPLLVSLRFPVGGLRVFCFFVFLVSSLSEWVWLRAFWFFHYSASRNHFSSCCPQALLPVLITRPSARVTPRRSASKVATSCLPAMNARATFHCAVLDLNAVIVTCTISLWVALCSGTADFALFVFLTSHYFPTADANTQEK